MNLHLFSLPGPSPIHNIVSASRPYLEGQPRPVVLYLPAAGDALNSDFVGITQSAFRNLAEVEVLDLTAPIPAAALESAVQRATVLYIPGGNTYLLLHRLHSSGCFHLIQARVRAGMPLVGFSAGMVICGPNILTSKDKNRCGLQDFSGLRLIKYNFVSHYPASDIEKIVERDSRILDYHTFHHNPVLALEDDGYVEIDGGGANVVRGHCWLFESGKGKTLLEPGPIG